MSDPKWLTHAFKDKGVTEIKGSKHHPRVVKMHSYTTLKATDDETPWCSSGVCAWMEESGITSTKSAAAKSWVTWGEDCAPPIRGCVCVIQKRVAGADATTGSSSGYHVGLFLKQENNRVYLWGCNQSDSVKETGFSLDSYRIVATRWPKGYDKEAEHA